MKLRTKFQDEDFELGEVVDATTSTDVDGNFVLMAHTRKGGSTTFRYKSLDELIEDWEDYEKYWMINAFGDVEIVSDRYSDDMIDELREIGNYFETEEKAEKAVERLKAWKRLKDNGIQLVGWDYSANLDLNGCKFNDDDYIVGLSAGDIDEEDLDLLFGGEE